MGNTSDSPGPDPGSDDSPDYPLSSGATTRRARNSVTRDEVLAQALSIVDREGLQGLSMRALARALHVGPMRAYRHFESRSALLEALADQQATRIRELDLPPGLTPKELVIETGIQTRRILMEHPNLAPLVVSRPLSKATAANDLRLTAALLQQVGFSAEQVLTVSTSLTAYVMGFVLYELGQRMFHVEHREEMVAYYDELAAEVAAEPVTSRQVAGIRAAVDSDIGEENFRAGLTAMVDGFWGQRHSPRP